MLSPRIYEESATVECQLLLLLPELTPDASRGFADCRSTLSLTCPNLTCTCLAASDNHKLLCKLTMIHCSDCSDCSDISSRLRTPAAEGIMKELCPLTPVYDAIVYSPNDNYLLVSCAFHKCRPGRNTTSGRSPGSSETTWNQQNYAGIIALDGTRVQQQQQQQ